MSLSEFVCKSYIQILIPQAEFLSVDMVVERGPL
jgi:hypothetical protein